jgi:hypothetical protein
VDKVHSVIGPPIHIGCVDVELVYVYKRLSHFLPGDCEEKKDNYLNCYHPTRHGTRMGESGKSTPIYGG